jgi:hypothetical protein
MTEITEPRGQLGRRQLRRHQEFETLRNHPVRLKGRPFGSRTKYQVPSTQYLLDCDAGRHRLGPELVDIATVR